MRNLNIKVLMFILLLMLPFSTVFAETELSWTFDTQETLECVPSYKATVWSECTDGFQERRIFDANACPGRDKDERRACEIGNEEIDNMLLNSRSVFLEEIGDRIYSGQVSGTDYDYVYHSDYAIPDTSFIVLNKNEKRAYFGRLIDIDEEIGRYTYIIKDIEENDFDLLFQEGFLVNEALEDAQRQDFFTRYRYVAIMLLILLVAAIIMVVVFVIKKRNKIPGSDDKKDKKDHDEKHDDSKNTLKKTEHDQDENGSKKKEEIRPQTHNTNSHYSERDIKAVENYIIRNVNLSNDEILKNLTGIGWDEGLVKETIKKIAKR